MVSYTGTTFLSTLEGVMRSLPQTPCHAVRVKQGSQSLSTLYLYYIKTRAKCQVFFRFSFLFFRSLGRISTGHSLTHPIFSSVLSFSWYFLYWFAVCVRQLDPFKSFLLFSLINLSVGLHLISHLTEFHYLTYTYSISQEAINVKLFRALFKVHWKIPWELPAVSSVVALLHLHLL